MSRRYVIISPCRDEEDYLRRTLESVAAQSEPPACWVIVDDGSTDRTPQIIEEFAETHSYARVLTLPPRRERVLGPAVVHAFDAGGELVPLKPGTTWFATTITGQFEEYAAAVTFEP